eukprot:1247441-Lingulodinium_polyedra.AAC.1
MAKATRGAWSSIQVSGRPEDRPNHHIRNMVGALAPEMWPISARIDVRRAERKVSSVSANCMT